MPPIKKIQSKSGKVTAKSKTVPRGMAQPIEPGLVITDLMKKQWKLGPVIGQGGFGYIYLVDTASAGQITPAKASSVIKVEPYANGPLFVELAFYQRIAKAEMIDAWAKAHKKHIGMSVYNASGSFEHSGARYRFMVMDRFGIDVEKLYKECDYCFPKKTVYSLGLRIIDTLEYIHDHEYVHADIKSSNLMMGFMAENKHKVYLLDYGLAYRYCPGGKHVSYKEDPKRKHDGTIEYTSRDAHKGLAPSRRGDLEILAYCMAQWLCKKLPWENNLIDKDYVAQQKCKHMNDIPGFMKECFGSDVPVPLENYLQLVAKLKYDERPDYEKVRKLFTRGLKELGITDDGVSVCLPEKSPQKRGHANLSSLENGEPSPKKPRSRNLSLAKNSPLKKPKKSTSPKERVAKKTVKEASRRTSNRTSRTVTSVKPTIVASASKVNGIVNSDVIVNSGTSVNGRIVHRRPRRKNVPTREFAQSP